MELNNPILVERFEPYFRHYDPAHHALRKGDRSIACKNIKTALAWLGIARVFDGDGELYDEQLVNAVRRFQEQVGNRNVDGAVGPGTRSRLVNALLKEFGASRFHELDSSEAIRAATVFLSYAWADTPRVNKLDQWLRDHGVRVIRDVSTFKPGDNVKDSISTSVLSADKVIAVYSEQSKTRDWPNFEHQIAE